MANLVGLGEDLGNGTGAWGTPDKVTAVDGIYATVGLTGGASNTLRCTMSANHFTSAFDAAGILVEVDIFQPVGGTANFALIQLVESSTAIGTDQSGAATIPTTLGWVSFGGATNTMGYSGHIPQAVVNDGTFGVDIQVQGGASDSSSIDAVRITKYDAAGATESAEAIVSRICISG